jgi:hypothetical protein
MFADDDLHKTALKNNMLYNASDIYIEHRHYSVGKAVYDKTYQSENDRKVYTEGEQTYFNRARLNFPL